MKFAHPPINELAIGIYFQSPVTELRGEHVGLFWSSIRDEFPSIEQQPPIAPTAPGLPPLIPFDINVPNEIFPMPRYWLGSADGVSLIQVQRNAFLFNWRKRDAAYPHFDEVKKSFDRHYDRYRLFLQNEFNAPAPAPLLCELTYINLIEVGSLWNGAADTHKVVPSFSVPPVPGSEAADFLQASTYRLRPDIWLTVQIKSGTRPLENDKVLVIELKANGTPTSPDAANQWFEDAHTEIRAAFLKLTSEQVQRECWQPQS